MKLVKELLLKVAIIFSFYLIFVQVFNYSEEVATERSLFYGILISLYLVIFGKVFPPGKVNPNLF